MTNGFFGSEIKGNGTYKVLVLGNSHAQCIVPAIKQALEGQYSELNSAVFVGMTPFEGFKYERGWMPKVKQVAEHYKPDIIYLTFKYQADFEEPPIYPVETDLHTIKIQEMIDFLSNHSKVLFVNEKDFEAKGFTPIKFPERMYRSGCVSHHQFSQKV